MKCYNKYICCKKSGEYNIGGSLLFSGLNLRFNLIVECLLLDFLVVSIFKIINGKDYYVVWINGLKK